MHPVIEFYLGQRKTERNLTLEDLWELPDLFIGKQYFYIPWLFPVEKPSKWNHRVPLFQPVDTEYFRNNIEIQQKFLKSFDSIIHYFGIQRENDKLIVQDKILERNYWLDQVGHETKKISRIIVSLHLCGQPELAKQLQQLAIQLGQEKGYLLPETLDIWYNLIPE